MAKRMPRPYPRNIPQRWRNEYQRPESETLEARYRVYCEAMHSMGREPKSFDDWLNS